MAFTRAVNVLVADRPTNYGYVEPKTVWSRTVAEVQKSPAVLRWKRWRTAEVSVGYQGNFIGIRTGVFVGT
jgi:hypothetical protein